ncbi:MAG TPA: exonuclease SbcCD subunit D [candidate division Zixibacteria bacterium]|nr:exonuclease SbcCD subunit D [candidate division Zixibacteria bacterium]
MFKFAHLADCHVGANKGPVLEKLELAAFNKAMDICIKENVDFVLISGDLFHANLPDMYVANEAVKKMKEVKDAGIPFYVIYGSHDYSPNGTSIIDILDSTGLIKKVVRGEDVDGKLRLGVFTDPKTRAKLVGISGRKAGLEKNYFEILDREWLEKEQGFKIFAFHSAISELKPEFLAQMESTPVSLLPKGFDYYASGHVHKRTESGFAGYERVVFPGALFGGYSRDLEDSAKGEKRGFYIVSFDDKVEDVKFMEVSVCDFEYFEYDVSDKNSMQAMKDLLDKLSKTEAKNKIAVVKIKGELSGGKTSDISSGEIRDLLKENGALDVIINRYGLTSRDYASVKVVGEDVPTIENKLLRENIGAVKVSLEELKADKGAKLAQDLLKVLRQEQKLNETKKDYVERIQKHALEALGLGDEGP